VIGLFPFVKRRAFKTQTGDRGSLTRVRVCLVAFFIGLQGKLPHILHFLHFLFQFPFFFLADRQRCFFLTILFFRFFLFFFFRQFLLLLAPYLFFCSYDFGARP